VTKALSQLKTMFQLPKIWYTDENNIYFVEPEIYLINAKLKIASKEWLTCIQRIRPTKLFKLR